MGIHPVPFQPDRSSLRRGAIFIGLPLQAAVTLLCLALPPADRLTLPPLMLLLGAIAVAVGSSREAGLIAAASGAVGLTVLLFGFADVPAVHWPTRAASIAGLAASGAIASAAIAARRPTVPSWATEPHPAGRLPFSELRRAKQELAERDSRILFLYDKAAVAVESDDPNGPMLEASERLIALLGIPRNRLLTTNLFELTEPDDRPRETELFDQLLKNAIPSYTTERRLRRGDGSPVWTRTTTSLAHKPTTADAPPEAQRLTVVVDITELRVAEAARRESEATYRSIFDIAGAGLAQTDLATGRIMLVNVRLCEMTGYTADELQALRFDDLALTDQPGLIGELLDEQSDHVVETQIRCKDGRPLWVQVTATAMGEGEGPARRAVAMVQDISARREAAEALRTSEARLRLLAENATDLISQHDSDLQFTYASPASLSMLGFAPEELVGQPIDRVWHPSDRGAVRQAWAEALENGPTTLVARASLKDGSEKWLETSVRAVAKSEGQPLRAVAVTRDITERRRLEEELRQAQKLEAIGQLAGGIAHDFNNLLTVISGNLALLELPPNDKAADARNAAEHAANRAAELTKQLLGYARRSTLELRPVKLGGLVKQTLALLKGAFDPRIEIVVAGDGAVVQGDSGQLHQVLMNLCINARDAMPNGGRLLIDTAAVEIGENDIPEKTDRRPGLFARLRVGDTGSGMTEEVRARIFEPFFTTKQVGQGTGLGLAMVYGIVRQHTGWIECNSAPGCGTTFDLYLPQAAGEAVEEAPLAALPEDEEVTAPSARVLLVDDEPLIRNLGERILAGHGYDVVTARDGIDAVEKFQATGADLVVLDLSMPRQSGIETLRQLKSLAPDLPVLLSSGFSAEQISEDDREACAGFVKKPYRPRELLASVREALAALVG